MSHSRLLTLAGIFIALLIGGFALSVPHTRDILQGKPAATETASVPEVTFHDAYKKGVHTIAGSLFAPDACTTIAADTVTSGDASTTETINVAITLTPSAGVCLELPTKMTFSATATAGPDAAVSVTVNGAVASTTES